MAAEARLGVFVLAALAMACGGSDNPPGSNDSGDGTGEDSAEGGDDDPNIPAVGLVCEGSDERDVSNPDVTIAGDACNESSIRAAVEAGGIIVVDCDTPVLFTAPLRITTDTTIDGSARSVLDGGGTTRLLDKQPGPWLHLQNLTLTHAQAPEALGDPEVTQANWFRWAGGAINAQCHANELGVGGGLSGKRLICSDNATGSHTRDPMTGQILDTGNGGCAYLFACEFECDECEFSNNRATNGGAIGALGAKTRLTNSTCVGNEARRNDATDNDNQGCGGCYCQDGTETGPGEDAENYVHFCGNVLANNRADQHGGAVSIFYRQQTHTSIRFERNSCQGNRSGELGTEGGGGCLFMYVDVDTKLPMAPDVGPDTFVFSGNAVYDNSTHEIGGGAAIFNIWNTAVRFDNNVFLRNEVRTTNQETGGGGGLGLIAAYFPLEHNAFVDNVANNWTGGVALGLGGVALRNNLFVNNNAPLTLGDPTQTPTEHINWVLDETDDGQDSGFLVFASGGNLFIPSATASGEPRPSPGAAVLDVDPQLSELVTDDGLPPYLAIGASSPAIDAGVPTESVTHDIRGVRRDGSPDIGPFELAP